MSVELIKSPYKCIEMIDPRVRGCPSFLPFDILHRKVPSEVPSDDSLRLNVGWRDCPDCSWGGNSVSTSSTLSPFTLSLILRWFYWVDSLYNVGSSMNHLSSKNASPNGSFLSLTYHFKLYIYIYQKSLFLTCLFDSNVKGLCEHFHQTQIQMEKVTRKNTIESPCKPLGAGAWYLSF